MVGTTARALPDVGLSASVVGEGRAVPVAVAVADSSSATMVGEGLFSHGAGSLARMDDRSGALLVR
jgi:hypothetical protein